MWELRKKDIVKIIINIGNRHLEFETNVLGPICKQVIFFEINDDKTKGNKYIPAMNVFSEYVAGNVRLTPLEIFINKTIEGMSFITKYTLESSNLTSTFEKKNNLWIGFTHMFATIFEMCFKEKTDEEIKQWFDEIFHQLNDLVLNQTKDQSTIDYDNAQEQLEFEKIRLIAFE